ncbi:hypothetical protein ACIBFB_21435 [Nocardiopsis sp. NPDC050513]|uniref:hypothetical protein n=1 Tax=Nocardiopsis sp. NPDC050513 TaxID=3364338 RepID=UPI0037A039D1
MPPVDVSQPSPDARFQQPIDPDPLTLVYPPAIPIPGTTPESLQAAAADIGAAASEISQGANDIRSTWQGLQPHYSAPEAEDLFAVMDPVAAKGDTIQDDLADAVSALEEFAEAAETAKSQLRELRDSAWGFYEENKDDEFWHLNPWKLGENRALKLAVNRVWARFQEAERDCANRIVAVYGGDTTYTAASAGEPGANEIVHGIDPDDIPDTDYDLTSFEDWQRVWEDANHIARDSAKPWPLDWAADAYYANWDNFGGGMVWDTAVGAVAATGLWRAGSGWAETPGEALDNAVQHQEERLQGLGALAGVYGEDGWMNPFSGPDAGTWDGDMWRENAGAAWTEVAHEFLPWREWDDRPAYTVYTGAGNLALTVVAFPVRGGTILARLGSGDFLDGGRVPDDLSPGDMPTHWENGAAGRVDFDLSEHLAPDGGGHAGATSIDELLRGLSTDFEARFGGPGGGAPHGDRHHDGAASESPSPEIRSPATTGDRTDTADPSSERVEDDERIERQAGELVTEVDARYRDELNGSQGESNARTPDHASSKPDTTHEIDRIGAKTPTSHTDNYGHRTDPSQSPQSQGDVHQDEPDTGDLETAREDTPESLDPSHDGPWEESLDNRQDFPYSIPEDMPADLASEVSDTVSLLESVHRFPENMRTVRFETGPLPPGVLGRYEMRTRTITFDPAAPRLRENLIHEIGHALDHLASPNPGVASAVPKTTQMRDWRRAVVESWSYHRLDAEPSTRYQSYLLRNTEMWARSYTQWVAERSGDARLRDELRQHLSGPAPSRYRQWEDEEFQPIAEAIDKVIEEDWGLQ